MAMNDILKNPGYIEFPATPVAQSVTLPGETGNKVIHYLDVNNEDNSNDIYIKVNGGDATGAVSTDEFGREFKVAAGKTLTIPGRISALSIISPDGAQTVPMQCGQY